MCDQVVCEQVVCGQAVCEQVVCGQVACGQVVGGGGGVEEEEGRRRECTTKSKDPTQRCGEQYLDHVWYKYQLKGNKNQWLEFQGTLEFLFRVESSNPSPGGIAAGS